MIELIAEYIVVNHQFGIAKQEFEYLRNDRLAHPNPQIFTTDELEAEQRVSDLYHQRESVIEKLGECLKQS